MTTNNEILFDSYTSVSFDETSKFPFNNDPLYIVDPFFFFTILRMRLAVILLLYFTCIFILGGFCFRPLYHLSFFLSFSLSSATRSFLPKIRIPAAHNIILKKNNKKKKKQPKNIYRRREVYYRTLHCVLLYIIVNCTCHIHTPFIGQCNYY